MMRKRAYKTCMYCAVLGGEVFGGIILLFFVKGSGGVYIRSKGK